MKLHIDSTNMYLFLLVFTFQATWQTTDNEHMPILFSSTYTKTQS